MIYIAPSIFATIVSVLVLLVFTDEPVTYCIMNDREVEGKRQLARIFKKKDRDSDTSLEDIVNS